MRGAAGLAFAAFVTTFGADLVGRVDLADDFAGLTAPVVLESAFTNAPLSIPAQPRTPRLRARLASSAFDLSLSDPAVFIGEPLPARYATVEGRVSKNIRAGLLRLRVPSRWRRAIRPPFFGSGMSGQ